MDMQQCSVCKRSFDFDTSGFGSDLRPDLWCSVACAKKGATNAGNCYVVHDKTGGVVEHNVPVAGANVIDSRTGQIAG